MIFRCAFISALVVTSLFAPAATAEPGAFSPDGGRYLFWATWGGDMDIWMVRPATGELTRLTNLPGADGDAVFSPDGKRIAFFTYRGSSGEIYLMTLDGGEPLNLTRHPDSDFSPSYSPEGRRIVFESYRDGHGQIYAMSVDGSGQINLSNNSGSESDPAFSPDGRQIAFVSRRGGDFEVYMMNADGSEQRALTQHRRGFHNPKWSPDGARLVFHSDEYDLVNDRVRGSVFILDIKTGGLSELSLGGSYNLNPFFRPDGRGIGFNSMRDSRMFVCFAALEDGPDGPKASQPVCYGEPPE